MRAAKAELLMQLAASCDRWRSELLAEPIEEGQPRPFDTWPDTDPLKKVVVDNDLTPEDVAKLCNTLGDQMEGRAIRAGIED